LSKIGAFGKRPTASIKSGKWKKLQSNLGENKNI